MTTLHEFKQIDSTTIALDGKILVLLPTKDGAEHVLNRRDIQDRYGVASSTLNGLLSADPKIETLETNRQGSNGVRVADISELVARIDASKARAELRERNRRAREAADVAARAAASVSAVNTVPMPRMMCDHLPGVGVVVDPYDLRIAASDGASVRDSFITARLNRYPQMKHMVGTAIVVSYNDAHSLRAQFLADRQEYAPTPPPQPAPQNAGTLTVPAVPVGLRPGHDRLGTPTPFGHGNFQGDLAKNGDSK